MAVGIAIGAAVILGVLIWLGSGITVGKSRLAVSRSEAHFPQVSGFNLLREERQFPDDFQGSYNLVFVPFQQWQQGEVNTWIPAAQELERTVPGLFYYEFPTIYELPGLSRTFINEGMRAGIPDQTARERTITFYLDKEKFKDALQIPSEEATTILLVDPEGNILWRETGVFNEDKLQSLFAVLELSQ